MKKPSLLPEWKRLVKKAWSIRLIVLAGVLTGAEAVLSAVGTDWLPVPHWARMLLLFAVLGGAFVARLLAQPEKK